MAYAAADDLAVAAPFAAVAAMLTFSPQK